MGEGVGARVWLMSTIIRQNDLRQADKGARILYSRTRLRNEIALTSVFNTTYSFKVPPCSICTTLGAVKTITGIAHRSSPAATAAFFLVLLRHSAERDTNPQSGDDLNVEFKHADGRESNAQPTVSTAYLQPTSFIQGFTQYHGTRNWLV